MGSPDGPQDAHDPARAPRTGMVAVIINMVAVVILVMALLNPSGKSEQHGKESRAHPLDHSCPTAQRGRAGSQAEDPRP